MANPDRDERNPYPCAVCKTAIDLNRFGDYVGSPSGAVVCKHCAVSAPREVLSEAVSEVPTPPLKVEPSAAARAMMRALGDQLAMSLPMIASCISAACERAVVDLRTGRLDLFLIASVEVSNLIRDLGKAFLSANHIDTAIVALDPGYAIGIEPTRHKLIMTHEREKLAGIPTMEVAERFVMHHTECQKGETCPKHKALRDELKTRGVNLQ